MEATTIKPDLIYMTSEVESSNDVEGEKNITKYMDLLERTQPKIYLQNGSLKHPSLVWMYRKT